jgi:hypothetical protein
MIHVLEMPCDAPPRVWFAFDADDLARKLDASDVAELHAAGRCRVFADESAALAAFERAGQDHHLPPTRRPGRAGLPGRGGRRTGAGRSW